MMHSAIYSSELWPTIPKSLLFVRKFRIPAAWVTYPACNLALHCSHTAHSSSCSVAIEWVSAREICSLVVLIVLGILADCRCFRGVVEQPSLLLLRISHFVPLSLGTHSSKFLR